jgi:hypothetical protein
MAHRDMLRCGGRASLTEHCGHGWTSCPARSRLTRGNHQGGPVKKGLLRAMRDLILIAVPS